MYRRVEHSEVIYTLILQSKSHSAWDHKRFSKTIKYKWIIGLTVGALQVVREM